MTSNGAVAPTEEVTPTDQTQPQQPALSVTSMDYWREMTERQVERLQARIAEIMAEAMPLRQQVAALTTALTAVSAAPEPKQRGGRRPTFGMGDQSDAKNRGANMTQEQAALAKQMTREGKTTAEVRAMFPGVKSGHVYNAVYNERQRILKEAKPR